MALVERSTQLEDLARALDQAAQGRGRTVLLSGEAGIGKTSLLRAFAEVTASRARVFEGRCDELITPRVLGPFRDMARHHRGVFAGTAVDDRDAVIDVLITEMSFRQRPAVVIVEDLHWADHASLDVVSVLARRVPDLPAVLIVSYRDNEAHGNRRLKRVLGSLAGPATIRIRLDGLSDTTVADLADAAGLDGLAVVAAVGGNPFYLSEVILAGGAAVPASVRDAVLARVSSLPQASRAALGRLAVVPTEVEAWLVPGIVDDAADLEAAERCGILRATGGGLRFRHEIAREVVESSLSDVERAAAHRRVLAALRATDAEASRLVHHAMGARDHRAAGRCAVTAAHDAARADSHPEAVTFARLALRYAPDPTAADRARLHSIAAAGLYAMNHFGDAAVHADQAVDAWLAAGSDPAAAAEALLFSARLSTLLADPVADRAKALRAVELLAPLGPSRTLALAYSTMAAQDTLRGRIADAVPWIEQAVELARLTGSADVESHALGYRGVGRCLTGDEAGLADLRTSVEIAQRIGHADYLTVAAQNTAVVLMRSGRVLEAEPYLDLAERTAVAHRLESAQFRIAAQQCYVASWRGQWDAAEARLRELVDADVDAGANAVNPLAFLGRILARRGDPAAGLLIERAEKLAAASGEEQKLAVAVAATVEWRWLADDADGVRAAAERFRSTADVARHRLLHAEVLRHLRRLGEPVTPFDGCFAPYAAGIRGDWATAAALWLEAGNPYERAWELCAAPDIRVVGQGLAILDRLGAAAAAAVIRRRLRAAGVRNVPRGPRAATRANLAGLTDRQLEIVALLREGCTNGEIAQRLYLSQRTVDNHVSALLRRLGVRSRRQVADALRQT
jgi:DNA-binding CsgD family transcriptional regulator/tetratricopeptide (TPR) repeat protein